MKTQFKHEESGATLYREIAQPHVTTFAEVFPDAAPYDVMNCGKAKHPFDPRYIRGKNIAGNLYSDCKAIMQGKQQKKHPDEEMRIGPYCAWRKLDDSFASFSVSCADWVLSRIRERTIVIGDDRMSFEISDHDNGWSLVTANHSVILGSVWLAYIRTNTIPKA